MNKIPIVCSREADFPGPHGELFRIRGEEVGKCVEAPEWICKTLIFRMLQLDGMISVSPGNVPEEAPEKPEAKDRRKRTTKKKDDAE